MTLSLCQLAVVTALQLSAAPAFDSKPWVEDLEQARKAFAEKYSNLEWAVFEREADLNGLFADARTAIEAASTDVEAMAAFDRLARRLGDGHVVFRWSTAAAKRVPPSAGDTCTALGFKTWRPSPVAARHLTGYVALETPQSEAFPAGLIKVRGKSLGIIRIGLFMPEGLPKLCAAAVAALHISAEPPCDEACSDRIHRWAYDRLTHDLESQLRALEAAGAKTLMVDITDNGGGSEWAEAVARMLTPVRLKSERAGFVRGQHWVDALTRQEAELSQAVARADATDQRFLSSVLADVRIQRREAATPCDSAPLWRGQRPSCAWLGTGFYSSGPLASADPATLRGKPWASRLFSPMQYPYDEGVWRGPLIVLVDGDTGSAAEEFAAILQDNHAALIVGAPTYGAGCGHTDGGTPTTLSHSGAVLELPDCARWRADGTNEVMGIQPDLLIGFRRYDGARRRSVRLSEKLAEASLRATELWRRTRAR